MTHAAQQLLLDRESASDVQFARLLGKIESREAIVSVIGLGYVGLPLAVAFAKAGFPVVGIDKDEAKVDAIHGHESYVGDVSSDTLRTVGCDNVNPSSTARGLGLDRGKLFATTDYDVLAETDIAFVCVPTPLSKTKEPDISQIVSVSEEIASHLHSGMLIVLESTSYPGTTEELVLPRLQGAKGRSLAVGTDFFLAFSPERIDPGRQDWTIQNTPKIVGGVTERCTQIAKAAYECAVQETVPVSSPRVAEMVKLLENTFRAVNVGLVNEFAMMCSRLGVDVWEVIDAAKTKPFGYMPFYPGPGLGGHCIPVDPRYLAWKLKTMDYNARFIQLAEEINFGMPLYVLGKIADELNERGKPLKGSRVLVLGVAYKADVSDARESPALDLMYLLLRKGVDLAYHDPYLSTVDVGGQSLAGVRLDSERLRWADCVVITTAHGVYDWDWVVGKSALVVDTRNATARVPRGLGRVVKL